MLEIPASSLDSSLLLRGSRQRVLPPPPPPPRRQQPTRDLLRFPSLLYQPSSSVLTSNSLAESTVCKAPSNSPLQSPVGFLPPIDGFAGSETRWKSATRRISGKTRHGESTIESSTSIPARINRGTTLFKDDSLPAPGVKENSGKKRNLLLRPIENTKFASREGNHRFTAGTFRLNFDESDPEQD